MASALTALVICQSPPTRDATGGDGTSLIAREIIARAPSDAVIDLIAFGLPGQLIEPAVVARCRSARLLPHRRERFPRQHLLTAWSQWGWEISGPEARMAVSEASSRVGVTLLVGPQTIPLASSVTGHVVVCEVDPWVDQMIVHADGLAGHRRLVSRAVTARGDRAIRRAAASARDWVVVSTSDAARHTRRLGRPVTAIPIGVTLLEARPELPAHTPPVLGFVGSLDFAPNEQAVAILAREVLPRVRSAIPGTELVVAGRNPTAGVRGAIAAAPGARLIADFPDLGDVLDQIDVLAFPDREGFGTRNSVLEAVAAHKPVVATVVAGRGQPALTALDLLPVTGDVAAACVAVLSSPEAFEAARERSRQAAQAVPGWDESARQWWSLLEAARR